MYPTSVELYCGENFNGIKRKNSKIHEDCEKLTRKLTNNFSKIIKSETYIVNEGTKFKRIFILTTLSILFISSIFGTILMWYTNGFQNIVYSNFAIRKDSPFFELWRKPSVKPLVRIYIFNYTNVENYENGKDEKLHVEEKGPYVYEESMERVNVEFNGTYVTYQMKKNYKFMPGLSKGRQNDIVVVPNMLMLGVAGLHKYSSFFTRLAISKGLDGFYSKPFNILAADRFIIGHEDQLYSLSKSVMVFQNKILSEKLGLLSQKVGINRDVYTVHTGQGDINKIGSIVKFNGENQLKLWSTDECNSLGGTDGTLFSPERVRNKEPVQLFTRDLSRTVDMKFKEKSSIYNGQIETHKYVLPDYVFDSADNFAENQCFCEMDGGKCPLQGVFNITLSAMGAPTFVSFPHFYRGDSKLINGITGLNPNKTLHETYLELHPTMGFPVTGATRMQINMQVIKTFGFSQLDKYENELMLPLAWFELILDDERHSPEMTELINSATYTLVLVENLFKYGFLTMLIFTTIPLLANVIHRFRNTKSDITSH